MPHGYCSQGDERIRTAVTVKPGGALTRAAFALGYRRVITYTLASESGSSLRASGWKIVAQRPPRRGWSVPSRPRDDSAYLSAARQLWEKVA